MLNYIVCEDDLIFREEVVKQIENFMMKVDLDYKIHVFSNYDKKFEKIVNDDIGFKVFFLDIKTKYGSGLDAARYIREEADDWVSLIIVITAFSEYRYEALTNRLFLLDFINKLDNCKKKIQEDLKIILKHYFNRFRSLTYQYNYTIYKIEYRHILYIEKEQDSKRCIIHTTYGDYKIPKTLTELEKILDDRFLKVYRSIIVNLDMIRTYDEKNNFIFFDNGEKLTSISRNCKKRLIQKVEK